MLKTKLAQSMFCCFLGVMVGLVIICTLAYTAAFSAPRGIFLGFKSRAAFEIGLFFWDAIFVYGLGAGVIAFGTLLCAYTSLIKPTVQAATFYLASIIITIYLLVPLANNTEVSFALSRQWWAYGLELSLLASASLATWMAKRLWPQRLKEKSIHASF